MNILRNIFDVICKAMFVIMGIQYIFSGKEIEAFLCIFVLGIFEIIEKLDEILVEMRKK